MQHSTFSSFAWQPEFTYFALGYLILLCLLLLFFSVTGKLALSFWVLTTPLLFLSNISSIKYEFLGEPLLPRDFTALNELSSLWREYWSAFFNLRLVLIVPTLIILIRCTLRRNTSFKGNRLILALTSANTFFGLSLVSTTIKTPLAAPLNNQSKEYWAKSFVAASFLNLQNFIQPLSKQITAKYSPVYIDNIIAKLPAEEKPPAVKPNIIFILSESFFNLKDELPGVTFSQDPTPTFHKLAKEFPSGRLLSPQFGGKTANVEFEILTGNSMRFFPSGTIAYREKIPNQISSLASILKQQGYQTTAISAYHNWHADSVKKYPQMGFERFVPMEFLPPKHIGPYLADQVIADEVIETTKTNKPSFIFAATMGNHCLYHKHKFASNPIFVKSSRLSAAGHGILTSYTTGANLADQMLAQLVAHYSKDPRPTIILFFGDHLPGLGKGYKVYNETGYIKHGEPSEQEWLEKLYRPPVLLWHNYPLAVKGLELNTNASFLGPLVLDLTRMPSTPYMRYLKSLYKKQHFLSGNESKLGKELYEYEMLQYDTLYGKRYSNPHELIQNPNFNLGREPLALNKIKLIKINNHPYLEIYGTFPELSKPFLGELSKEVSLRKHGYLRLPLTQSEAKTIKSSTINLKVLDNKNNVLAETGKIKIGSLYQA
jgi:hypothetical protein